MSVPVNNPIDEIELKAYQQQKKLLDALALSLPKGEQGEEAGLVQQALALTTKQLSALQTKQWQGPGKNLLEAGEVAKIAQEASAKQEEEMEPMEAMAEEPGDIIEPIGEVVSTTADATESLDQASTHASTAVSTSEAVETSRSGLTQWLGATAEWLEKNHFAAIEQAILGVSILLSLGLAFYEMKVLKDRIDALGVGETASMTKRYALIAGLVLIRLTILAIGVTFAALALSTAVSAPVLLSVILLTNLVQEFGYLRLEQEALAKLQDRSQQLKNDIHRLEKELKDSPNLSTQDRIEKIQALTQKRIDLGKTEKAVLLFEKKIENRIARRNKVMYNTVGSLVMALGAVFPPLLIVGATWILMPLAVRGLQYLDQRFNNGKLTAFVTNSRPFKAANQLYKKVFGEDAKPGNFPFVEPEHTILEKHAQLVLEAAQHHVNTGLAMTAKAEVVTPMVYKHPSVIEAKIQSKPIDLEKQMALSLTGIPEPVKQFLSSNAEQMPEDVKTLLKSAEATKETLAAFQASDEFLALSKPVQEQFQTQVNRLMEGISQKPQPK